MKTDDFYSEANFPELLSQNDVAKLLGKSTAWCERMRWQGGGPPFRKIGRHVRYEKRDLLNWINSHPKVTSTSSDGGQQC